jgi:hypothetical protein
MLVTIPATFAAPKILRRLNVLAVGLSLAAVTAAVFGAVSHDFSGLITGPSTLVIGMIWAWILRFPYTIGKSSVRWAWLASVPLAALNGGLACTILLASPPFGPWDSLLAGYAGGILFGAVFGMILWAPALVVTLTAFGLPIAWAQKLAKRGLAGEERGELIIGAICTLLALAALGLSFQQKQPPMPPTWANQSGIVDGRRLELFSAGVVFMRVVAAVGVLAGGAATVLAASREARRRAFVARAERGEVPGFRVDATPEGKALVRVSSAGQGYRVAELTEEVVLLDDEGRATDSRLTRSLSRARCP